MATTKCLWSLPAGVRSAVDNEARRRGTTPSRLVSEFFSERFPDYVAESIRQTIRVHLDELGPKRTDERKGERPKPTSLGSVPDVVEDEVG
jgi:hypothetical protein